MAVVALLVMELAQLMSILLQVNCAMSKYSTFVSRNGNLKDCKERNVVLESSP